MKLLDILKEKKMTRHRLAKLTDIAPGDLYCAIDGKKPLYPGYRRRIAEVLAMKESEVFPDYEVQNDGNS